MSLTLLFIGLATAFLWLSFHFDEVQQSVAAYVENGDVVTLPARYTAEDIAERAVAKSGKGSLTTPPEPLFRPYLLFDVKYLDDHFETREGMLLWSLTDGEMVLETEQWSTTHGFRDCIRSGADRNDYLLIQALARHRGGKATREQLQKELGVEKETFTRWCESAEGKHLIVRRDPFLQLHFQNPRFPTAYETTLSEWFVTKPLEGIERMPKLMTRRQIQKVVEKAFPSSFSIRSASEIYIPFYLVTIENGDGSSQKAIWNALTGNVVNDKGQ